MILAPLWRVEPDAVLARTVVAHGGGGPQALLEAGRRLSPALVAALSRADVRWVYVESDIADGISPGPLLPGAAEDACRPALEPVFETARNPNRKLTGRHIDDLCEMAAKLLVAARARVNAPLGHDPTRAGDDVVGHALSVALIGLAIGEIVAPTTGVAADAVAWHLTHLGAGLLLHDIGVVATPPDVLSTLGPLNEMQREMVRWHPRAGEEMLSATVPPSVRAAVSHHHEWFSGGGYPDGVAGEDIHINARIAAVAAAYDALATRSLTVGGRPGDGALRMVRRFTGSAFDPSVTAALDRVVAAFAPGCPVLLSDGTRGIVVRNTPGAPQHPTVRITHTSDARPLAPDERCLTDGGDALSITQVLDHPAASPAAVAPTRTRPPEPPPLAIRGLEAGGLLDAAARAASPSFP